MRSSPDVNNDAISMNARKRSHDEIEEDATGKLEAPAETVIERLHEGHGSRDTEPNDGLDDGFTLVKSRKRRKKMPRKDSDKYPSITHASHARLQGFIKISDLQNLVLYLLADGSGPQWCAVKHQANVKKVVVLMVPGLEMSMFDGKLPLPTEADEVPTLSNGNTTISTVHSKEGERNGPVSLSNTPDDYYPRKIQGAHLPNVLSPMKEIFEHVWPIKTPGDDKYAKMHSPLASMLITQIQKSKDEKNNRSKGPTAATEAAKRWHNVRTPITEFIATTDELMIEGHTLHPAHFANDPLAAETYRETRVANKRSTADGWVDSRGTTSLDDGNVPDGDIEQGAILAGRTVLAIDCEMCITSPEEVQPPVLSLTRMTLVNWDGDVVLDELVKPDDPITNYLTPYSGITEHMLRDVTTTLKDAQRKLLNKLDTRTILVGHSLESDLAALRVTHPFIIDTSLLYPHPRGPPLKSSLKWLAQKYLNRSIQAGHGSTGHNSIEDARASLDLVRQKCEKGKHWGTAEVSTESIFLRLGRAVRPKRYKKHPDGEPEHRTGAVVDWGEPMRGFGSHAKLTIGCQNDTEVVEGIKQAVNGKDGDDRFPIEGVDLTWARMRELEAYRKWWQRSKTQDNQAMREEAVAGSDGKRLGDIVARTTSHIEAVWEALPPCTALIVYSGSGDPRKLSELQEIKQKHKAEYAVKKWDELTVKWTDHEEQELRQACEMARRGIGFIAVK